MLERENPKPLYVQLQDIIREKIDNEEWTPHHAIPSENELSKLYGVSRMTARAVVTQIVREGLLYRVPGKGTYVAEPKITTDSLSYKGIREQLECMGYQTVTKLVEVKKTTAPERVAKALDLSSNEEVYVVERLRYIQEEPLSYHISYVPAQCCAQLEKKDFEGEQLCVILDQEYGLKRGKVVETLESCLASDKSATLLCIKKGYPLLMLEDIISDVCGKPFEYTRVYFRGDKIKIRFEFDT